MQAEALLMLLNIMNKNFSRQSVIEFATFENYFLTGFLQGKNFPRPVSMDAIFIVRGFPSELRSWI